ncbi:MAG: porin [Pseudomonadota bacterium]
MNWAPATAMCLATVPKCAFTLLLALSGPAHAVEFKLGEATTANFSGWINRGILFTDDGDVEETFFFVDNDNLSTRARLTTSTTLGSGFIFKTGFEGQFEPISTFNIDILDPRDEDFEFDQNAIRRVEISLEHKDYGKLSIGQGAMSSDGAAEIDLSDTQVVSLDPRFTAGGQFFRFSSGDLSSIRVSADFNSFDGGRLNRIRYDTPAFRGFTLSGAVAHDILNGSLSDQFADVALRYANTVSDYQVSGALFYFHAEASTDVYGGSFAVLHKPSGLNARFAAGGSVAGADYWTARFGWKKSLFAFGQTALAVDYYSGNDMQSPGAESETYSASIVQRIDRFNLEIYGHYRRLKFDTVADDFKDLDVFLTGFRWQF